MLSLLTAHRKSTFHKTLFSIDEVQALDRLVQESNAQGGVWLLRDGEGTDVIDRIEIVSSRSNLGASIFKMHEDKILYAISALGGVSHSRNFSDILKDIGRKLSDYTLIEIEIATDAEPESLASPVGMQP